MIYIVQVDVPVQVYVDVPHPVPGNNYEKQHLFLK